MSQNHCTTKSSHYTHLSESERGQIQAMINLKVKPTAIAAALGRNPSTIYREIKRHSIEQRDTYLRSYKVYYADTAQILYKKARANCGGSYKLAVVPELVNEIEQLILTNKWSPDAAVGRLKSLGKMDEHSISTKTIYNYIHIGLSKVKPIDLHLKVRRKRPHKPPVIREDSRENSIDSRPEEVNNRSEFGHWEIDTVIGKRGSASALLTLVERVTRQEIIKKIDKKTATAVVGALDALELKHGERFALLFKSITSDNGTEFAFTKEMERSILTDSKRTHIYYAHPYRSGERGSNENGNALIRRFIPKGRSFDDISEDTLQRIQDWINSLPRRILGYKTSNEVYEEHLKAIAV
jgi:IS30 family transposase